MTRYLPTPRSTRCTCRLPNNLHAQWSIRAAGAGKHVLCEKPLAANATQARAMFEAAEKHGVYLVEAYPYRAQPQTLKVRELVAAGAIGRIQLIQASFGFPLTDAANIRMDPNLAGGALMDAGSYPVSFVRTVAGAAPSRVSAMSRWGATRRRCQHDGHARVSGWSSRADLVQLHHRAAPACLHCRRRRFDQHHLLQRHRSGLSAARRLCDAAADGMRAHEVIETEARAGFLAEAESFHDLVRFGWQGWTGASPEESIDIAMTLDALAASSRHGVPVEVGR